jgi:shikimate kinase
MVDNKMSLTTQNILFIGFMGVGKTTIGKEVARKLSRDFVDIDEEIEKEFNMPTTEIFKKIGEQAFREKEKSLIEHYSQQELKIISVGGGAFLQEEIRKICLANCIVLFLDLSWEYWKERIGLIIDSRPVLQGRTPSEIQELFNSRQEIYSYHHLKVNTDALDVEEIVDYVTESLTLAWQNPDIMRLNN